MILAIDIFILFATLLVIFFSYIFFILFKNIFSVSDTGENTKNILLKLDNVNDWRLGFLDKKPITIIYKNNENPFYFEVNPSGGIFLLKGTCFYKNISNCFSYYERKLIYNKSRKVFKELIKENKNLENEKYLNIVKNIFLKE